ncbi:MAG TPA: right-handed parallel beta-helix repeat-containing protein [Vicinamibacterales bacterium]|jgi:hypothetical protein|nr:right-handed parallel beta-helix repeat-containing protein [Vicinamibacterales bacterium]
MRYLWFFSGMLIALVIAVAQTSHVTADISVKTAADLQAALNAARPGDTILLDAGATYVGHFVLPARADGSDTRVITLKTGGPEILPEGRRMVPAAAAKLAKLQSPDGQAVLQTAPRAKYWRITLVEFMPNADPMSDIITLGDGSSAQKTLADIPSDITLDRVYVHGDANRGQKRAIALNSQHTTISNSYIADIKAVGQDAQAIAGWNGPGDYTIVNNYVEGAAENILFGGADPSILNLVPTHILIQGNTISKLVAWRGSSWQIKNLIELKNANDVTIDGNVIEHNWAAAQTGYAILMTVRNQDGGCPWCEVQQVQFTSNVVSDVEAGINILGTDDTHVSQQTVGLTFSNNIFDGVGGGYCILITHTPKDVVFDHNTIIASAFSGILEMENTVDGFAFTNNLTSVGQYGIFAAGKASGNDSIKAALPGAQVTANVLAGGNANVYPPGNFFPSVNDLQSQFVDFANHDYRLKPTSPWAHSGTDGKDPGANGPNGAPLPALQPSRR